MVHNSAVAPLSHDAGRVGVLLCHGFTGSPAAMRPWAEFLVRHGYSVRLPLLPGHGTHWRDLASTDWRDWYDTALAAFRELQSSCDQVFVCGLSMGGTLTLRLAQELGDEVAGIAVVNPLVHRMPRGSAFAPALHFVVPSIPGIGNDISKAGMNEHCYERVPVRGVAALGRLSRLVSSEIDRIQQPTIIFTSMQDHAVDPVNSQWLAQRLRAVDVSSVVLADSFHVATLDHDADAIFEATLAFVRRLSR